jgi:hypothetical protein
MGACRSRIQSAGWGGRVVGPVSGLWQGMGALQVLYPVFRRGWECCRSCIPSGGEGGRTAGHVTSLWDCCRSSTVSSLLEGVGVLRVLYPVCGRGFVMLQVLYPVCRRGLECCRSCIWSVGEGWSVAVPVSGLLEGLRVL